ncbi:MAG: hypothetical protein JO057_26995 [Chloroflexi bacterium]|nr:hypothetical protein [Chloroflexota bacterium]
MPTTSSEELAARTVDGSLRVGLLVVLFSGLIEATLEVTSSGRAGVATGTYVSHASLVIM